MSLGDLLQESCTGRTTAPPLPHLSLARDQWLACVALGDYHGERPLQGMAACVSMPSHIQWRITGQVIGGMSEAVFLLKPLLLLFTYWLIYLPGTRMERNMGSYGEK